MCRVLVHGYIVFLPTDGVNVNNLKNTQFFSSHVLSNQTISRITSVKLCVYKSVNVNNLKNTGHGCGWADTLTGTS